MMLSRMVDSLREGLRLDQNLYEGCFWSAVGPLSEASVAEDGMPQVFPDFTRGNWKDTDPLTVHGARAPRVSPRCRGLSGPDPSRHSARVSESDHSIPVTIPSLVTLTLQVTTEPPISRPATSSKLVPGAISSPM